MPRPPLPKSLLSRFRAVSACGALAIHWALTLQPALAQRPSPEPAAGLLYYGKNDIRDSADNPAAIANPYITGTLFQLIWSEVEKREGEYDWSQLDRWMKPWVAADKKVAIRIMWSTSGYWPQPFYRTPTPQWVWQKGAVFAFHKPSGTEIPLAWDPIYQKYAWRFLEQFAARYGDNPHLLFVDVTPGAETNPYRFATINRRTPEFRETFSKAKASDGRGYREELWLEAVKTWIDAADRILRKTPLLVTLNVGGLEGPDRSVTIGDYCVAKGFWVGQNGLSGRSFLSTERGRAAAFVRWSRNTPLFFEMVHRSGRRTGTLMEVMQAAERIRCNYVNIYPEDVLKGTRGQPNYDPSYETALKYGHETLLHIRAVQRTEGGSVRPAVDTEADASQPAERRNRSAIPPRRGDRGRNAQRPRDREPSWLMPPVQGPGLHYRTFDSKTVGEKVSYLIYLPPDYEMAKRRRYPVVYWLHGIGGSQQGVPRMAQRLTDAIKEGKAPAMIVVYVNGMIRSSYVDSKDGRTPVETITVKELIPHVDATYRTIAAREGRMIEGFSMGGAGAAKWGLRHPEVFGSISILDGALHSGDPTTGRRARSFQTIYGGDRAYYDAHDPWKLVETSAEKLKGRTTIRIVTRTTGLGGANQTFHEHLERFGLASEFHVIPDAPHSPNPLYEGLGDKNWSFYRDAFKKAISADDVNAP